MGEVILRYLFVVAFLIVLMVVVNGFGYGLLDAYKYLTASGFSKTDAIGFLGVSMLASAKLNPTLGASAIAGALTGYILASGVKLVDALVDYINIRKGVAVVLPLNYQGDGRTVLVGPGEAAWKRFYVKFEYGGSTCRFLFEVEEGYNVNGSLMRNYYGYLKGDIKYENMGNVIDSIRNGVRGKMMSPETLAVADALLNMAQGWWLSRAAWMIYSIERNVVAGPTGMGGVVGSAKYTPVNKPVVTPEEADVGYSLLSNPSAFLDWARSKFGEDGIFESTVQQDVIKSMLNDIKAYLESLGVRNANIDNKITEIYQNMNTWNEVNENVTNVGNLTNEINNKVDNVTSAINELRQMVQGLQGQSGTVDLSEVIARLDAMESVLNSAVSGVDAKVQALSDAVGSMQQSIEEGKGILDSIKEWLDKFWDDLFTKWQEFLSGEWFLEWVKWLYHTLVVPEDYQEVWNDVVAGWREKVKFDVDIGSKLNVRGDSISDFSIPLGSWSIPVHLSSYIEMLGLRQLITAIVVASMWLGVFFAIIPRFVI